MAVATTEVDIRAPSLSSDMLVEMYATMVRARKLDERCWLLHRQGKIAFHISGMGHEAAQIGVAFAMRRGYDVLYPYYRDLSMAMALGMTPRDILLGIFGRAGDPSSGGRQMPAHYFYKRGNVFSVSSPVTTQVPRRPASRWPKSSRAATASSSPVSAKARPARAISTRRCAGRVCTSCP